MQDYEKLGVFYLGREYDAAGKLADDDLLLYDSKDLTTHAVCVGMTGSGKTGLCLALLEEAAIDGIPAICIDPKGDLGNLLLTFPNLAPADFSRGSMRAKRSASGVTVDQFAAQTAEHWKKGLAEWGQAPERIARFRDAVDVAIYTPGSESGLPLSVLRSFAAPPAELLSDTAGAARPHRHARFGAAEPAGPRRGSDQEPRAHPAGEHLRAGVAAGHESRHGAPDRRRAEAAVRQGRRVRSRDVLSGEGARASSRWRSTICSPRPASPPGSSGEPLDMQRLLFTPEGKPRIAIISIAHLSDAERMFIVTLCSTK